MLTSVNKTITSLTAAEVIQTGDVFCHVDYFKRSAVQIGFRHALCLSETAHGKY